MIGKSELEIFTIRWFLIRYNFSSTCEAIFSDDVWASFIRNTILLHEWALGLFNGFLKYNGKQMRNDIISTVVEYGKNMS
jgi:hypothetical protein